MLDYMVLIQVVVGSGIATSDAHVVHGFGHSKQKIWSAQFVSSKERQKITPLNQNLIRNSKMYSRYEQKYRFIWGARFWWICDVAEDKQSRTNSKTILFAQKVRLM